MRNYERDLAKLRQAELLVAKKSEQVEELVVGHAVSLLGCLLVCLSVQCLFVTLTGQKDILYIWLKNYSRMLRVVRTDSANAIFLAHQIRC